MGITASTVRLNENYRGFLKRFTILRDDMDIVHWYSNFLRECPDGRMTLAQCEKYFRELVPDKGEEYFQLAVTETYLRAFHTIDFKEFLFLLNATRTGLREDVYEWAFRLIDFNADGYISKEELTIFLIVALVLVIEDYPDDRNRPWADDVADGIFSDWDFDEDGYLNMSEFVACAWNTPRFAKLLKLN